MDYYDDVDMYGIPYQDHDPVLGLLVTIGIILTWVAIQWIYYKIKDYYEKF